MMKPLQEKLAKYDAPQKAKALGVYPYFRKIESEQDTEVIINGKKVLMFGSNSYLGLTNHPKIKEAAIAAIKAQIEAIEGVNGTLLTAQHTLNYYTKLLESVEKGEYEFAQSAIIAEKDAKYNARKAESEALQALFDAANEKKKQLLAAIAGE